MQLTSHTENTSASELDIVGYLAQWETYLIGSIVAKNDLYYSISEEVHFSDFYYYMDLASCLFTAIQKGDKVNGINLLHLYKKMGVGILSDDEVLSVCSNVDYARVGEYAQKVRSYSLRREEILLRKSSIAKLKSGENVNEVLSNESAQRSEFESGEKELTKLELAQLAIDDHFSAREKEDGVTGLSTGYADFDYETGGWQKGDLYVIAARPGMGKSTWAINLMMRACELGASVAYFSLEMDQLQIWRKINSMFSGVDVKKIRNGRTNEEEKKRIEDVYHNIYDWKFNVIANCTYLDDIENKCKKIQIEKGLDLIIVDYLQLIQLRNAKGKNRETQVSEISRRMKTLTRENSCHVPVIALSQLSRAVEARGGTKRPQLSDLRESGAIEQDASMVTFIYRPQYYGILEDEEGNSLEGIVELITRKNRHGALFTSRKKFEYPYAEFTELTDFSQNKNFVNDTPVDNIIKVERVETENIPF